MLDLTKPVQTRDGRRVRILCTDRQDEKFPIIALVQDLFECNERLYSYTKRGFANVGGGPSSCDLVNVPEKRSMWVNVYEKANNDVCHSTKREADKNQVPGRIACIELTYEVPQQ